MGTRNVLPVLLIVSFVFFVGLTTPKADARHKTTVALSCGSNCCCPPGCECCRDESETEQPADTILDEKHSSSKVSFWVGLACYGHSIVLSRPIQDPYILGLYFFALPNDVLSRKEGPDSPLVKDALIPPLDKIPKILS